ncbi:MAG: FtsQ-type POTRA domain-containing protein [Firmicutes bacterium]|nr:FtsQ-type POTRA domain-containing protein [Bacillota bacterium]
MDGAGSGTRKGKTFYWQSFFFIFIVILAVYILFQSPVFLIGHIAVQGNTTLTSADLINVSGIVTGINIFQVDLETAAHRVKALPMVKSADIGRKLPSTVLMRVEERVPVALVLADGDFVELDAEGYYLRRGKASAAGLPVITGVSMEASGPGQQAGGAGLDVALQVVGKLPAELRRALSEVNISDDGRVILYTMDGVECHLGLPEEVESKGRLVLDTLRSEGVESIEYVDFSILSSPVVKYKK